MSPVFKRSVVLSSVLALALGASAAEWPEDFAGLGPAWQGEVLSKIDQSYAGWDVEIGDADNDGKNEILVTGCPDSRLYLIKKTDAGWESRCLAENLAEQQPGMGLAVKIVDLNQDGQNEIILGTGQEGGGTARFYVLQTDGQSLTKKLVSIPEENKSSYTHNLAAADIDGDGLLEVLAAYCGGGEVMRYDVDADLTKIEARKVLHLSGSGEESLIADVDNDGKLEYLTSNSFRKDAAQVEIYAFSSKGELRQRPKVVLDGFDGHRCFYASLMVGDVDNDEKNELIVGWKREQAVNKSTLIGYEVDKEAQAVYSFAEEAPALDMGYFEKMMCIADVNNDGKNELVVSTRGDNASENITSDHWGHVFLFHVAEALRQTHIFQELAVNFNRQYAESSWVAIGDADNDGQAEMILATGKGDRTQPGEAYVVLVEAKK